MDFFIYGDQTSEDAPLRPSCRAPLSHIRRALKKAYKLNEELAHQAAYMLFLTFGDQTSEDALRPSCTSRAHNPSL